MVSVFFPFEEILHVVLRHDFPVPAKYTHNMPTKATLYSFSRVDAAILNKVYGLNAI